MAVLLSSFRGVVLLSVRLWVGSRYCRISRSLGESAASVCGVVRAGPTNPRVPLIAMTKELLGDPTYLYVISTESRYFGSAETVGILTSLAGGQPLPTLSNGPLGGVASSTLSSSTDHPIDPIFLLHVVEGVVLHS